jgi:methionyl aminopeptidase
MRKRLHSKHKKRRDRIHYVRIKTEKDIDGIRSAGRIICELFQYIKEELLKPGIRASELNRLSEEFIESSGGFPVFKEVEGYDWGLCVSINEEVAHGVPHPYKIIKAGDIVSIDVGVRYKGYVADATITFAVGEVSDSAKRLMKVGLESLYKGIEQAYVGNRLSEIGCAIERYAINNGCSVIREYVGHGVGFELHEAPQIKHYCNRDSGKLIENMVVAIEPMITDGKNEILVKDDRWTAIIKDGSLSVHFEHTIWISKNGPKILTPWEEIWSI